LSPEACSRGTGVRAAAENGTTSSSAATLPLPAGACSPVALLGATAARLLPVHTAKVGSAGACPATGSAATPVEEEPASSSCTSMSSSSAGSSNSQSSSWL
jgi:hypothetical protein